MLGGNIVIDDMLAMQGPLYFNTLLGRDYVYAMNAMLFILFRVMHFPHNKRIFIIDHLSYDNNHPNSTLAKFTPLYIPIFRVETTPPWVNYLVYYPWCLIASRKEPLQSCFPS